MEEKHLALERVPQEIQIKFSFPPFPGADLTTIHATLQEGALLLDAIRKCCMEHHVPVYLEHSFLSTAQTLIQESRRITVDQETKRINQSIFSKESISTDLNTIELDSNTVNHDVSNSKENVEPDQQDELAIQRSVIANYRKYTSQFYTQPEENMFPEAYHTLVHSPVPSLFDSILEVERDYAREVDALLSARDAEINDIQTKHNSAIASDAAQRNLTHLTTRYIERMEVAQATWNSQLDDLQTAQRSKYQEFILELHNIYKRRRNPNLAGPNNEREGGSQLDGKEMVTEAMNKIGARQSNIDDRLNNKFKRDITEGISKDLPDLPQTEQPNLPVVEVEAPHPSREQITEPVTSPNLEEIAPIPPPKPPRAPEEDPDLKAKIKSITEMGFTIEQARGALMISKRDLDHAINLLLEEPEKLTRLLLAKQKLDAMKESKENAKRLTRAQSSPQQPHPSLVNNSTPVTTQDLRPPNRPNERSVSISSPRPIGGVPQSTSPVGSSSQSPPSQKPWSPIPFFQNQTNALLTNNNSPSVKKFSGWLNKAIENLGRDDEENNGSESLQSIHMPGSNLDESFTVVLGSSHSKVTHNLRLLVSNPAEVFPSGRIRTEQDVAIHAQTASSLYGQNLTGLVQLVNIRDWGKYKGGQVCHQEFFKACQSSTELHFDSIEKQLEALESKFPLDGSTLREGDFFVTRHSNLPMIHVVFHLFYGYFSSNSPPTSSASGSENSSSSSHQSPHFSQSSEFIPKPDFLVGLKNIIRTTHRYEITMLSLPFLMMPVAFETQLVVSMSTDNNASSSSSSVSRHNRHSSSTLPSSNSLGGSSAPPPQPIPSTLHGINSNDNNIVYHITDQTRRDLQRRSEILLRNLKSYLMDNARQLKQVGNQGSDAEKFRASQGGDVMVVQFMLPKGTNDEMFRSFRGQLVNIFGIA